MADEGIRGWVEGCRSEGSGRIRMIMTRGVEKLFKKVNLILSP